MEVSIPRHREINDYTGEAICKDLEPELGKEVVAMSEQATAYTAVCIRSGGWWAVEVPEVPGVHTQSRRLDQAEGMAREAIALMLDVPQDDITVVVSPRFSDDDLDALVTNVRRLRQEAEEVKIAAVDATEEAVHQLRQLDLSMRDVARLLGISHQRVGQLNRR